MPQVSLALRSAQRGYLPDKSFVIVSFTATGVLLVGWRAALAAYLQVSYIKHRLAAANMLTEESTITAFLEDMTPCMIAATHACKVSGQCRQCIVSNLLSCCMVQGQSGKQPASQNRQGNPFEFLQLLASLTKRW